METIEIKKKSASRVVICFQISIFEPLGTISGVAILNPFLLWFAFKLVSLNHWEQSDYYDTDPEVVVICFQISIFEPLGTISGSAVLIETSCDLLSN